MLHYSVVFMVIALISAIFGFGSVAAESAWIAQVLFVLFLIVSVATFITGMSRRGKK